MNTQQDHTGETSWNLVALTPQYLPDEHGVYVKAIEDALKNNQIRNIALSGNYGVGKSSILRELTQRHKHRVVELSMSTLTPIETSKLDGSVPIQATTPTNRIQQEIVKQLLYRNHPNKTPGSRFRRIESLQWKREIVLAVILGLVVSVIFLLTGWTTKTASAFTPLIEFGIYANLIVWGVTSGITLSLRRLFYGKLRIKQFSAASATITLDDNSVSYFDQYLDEIIYFFEVSKCDVVIFEDIDRFNDSRIFETLRALNTLLNTSPQVDKPIRFIYAIKDSIFDRISLELEGRELEPKFAKDDGSEENQLESKISATDNSTEDEVIRANRTKFFDLIIPVVPFITHRSARNLAEKVLSKVEHKIVPELLDLAARYVPDMRLLKNVRNEFIVFHDRIFSGDGKHLNLSETDLFAMMLYKSTHMSDFETIRLGTSNLDILYNISRKFVASNIKKIEDELRELQNQLARVNGATTRSERLGEHLIAYIERTIEVISHECRSLTYIFDERDWTKDDLKSAHFWTNFTAAETVDSALLIKDQPYSYDTHRKTILTLSKKNLAAEIGDPLDAQSWNKADRGALEKQVDEKKADIRFLRSADFDDLAERPEFLFEYEEHTQPFEAIARAILKRGLAYQLVCAGYINHNFTLYTSTFHGGRVSSAATNFIIHNIERGLMDEHFELAPDDVDAIVRERGNNALREPALYNIAILDHLLATKVKAANIMIASLAHLEESQIRFLQAYLIAGEQRSECIKQFVAESPQVLSYLITQANLDDTSRQELVNVALAHLSTLKQQVDAKSSEYLSMHYTDLPTLTSDAINQTQAERIATLFEDANIIIHHLEPLGTQVRSSIVSRNLYQITYDNLIVATNNSTSLALDVIQGLDKSVYNYVINNVSAYLDAISDMSKTIDWNKCFIATVEDVLQHGSPYLGDVIKYAASDCKVKVLTEVSEEAWPALAEYKRFPASFNNVYYYWMNHSSIDAPLAKILNDAGKISDIGPADEESKTKLAIAILASTDQLPSAALRANLVASLGLENRLKVTDVAAEPGELFALLIKSNIIADEAEAYEYLKAADWPTRKSFIMASTKFSSYMSPELVKSDLEMLLKSNDIDLEIKSKIIEQATEYAEIADSQGLNELARYAIHCRQKLPSPVVLQMAQKGINTEQIALLLGPISDSISRNELFTTLQLLSGDYPKLTEVGHDKPRIPNTSESIALLERLKQEGIVSTYDEKVSPIKVNKKHN